MLAATAQAASTRASDGAMYVVFHTNHTVSATTATGQQLGTTSGAPTVVTPGHWNVYMDDSVGVSGPSFDLSGPGVALYSDMFYGENPSETYAVDLLPSATYTWKDDENPSVVFTFVTSSAGGSSTSSGGLSSGTSGTAASGGTSSSQDVVGSGIVTFRGSLDAIVYASGKLSLTRNGNAVASLKTGRYTFSVDDESRKTGFSVQVFHGKAQSITSKAYVGSRDQTVTLKPGRWSFFSPGGKTHTFYVTS